MLLVIICNIYSCLCVCIRMFLVYKLIVFFLIFFNISFIFILFFLTKMKVVDFRLVWFLAHFCVGFCTSFMIARDNCSYLYLLTCSLYEHLSCLCGWVAFCVFLQFAVDFFGLQDFDLSKNPFYFRLEAEQTYYYIIFLSLLWLLNKRNT